MPLLQDVCNIYGITKCELANMLGISKATLDGWANENKMPKKTRLALELILDDHYKSSLLSDISELISKISTFNTQNTHIISKWEDDQMMLVERIKYILDEFNLNTISASEKLNETSFEKLYKILKLQIIPDFDFLNKFSNTFTINNEWLKTGKRSPFEVKFIKSNNLDELGEEVEDFKKIYIIHSSDNKTYTEIVVEYQTGKFDIFKNVYCIGEDFIMSGPEYYDLYELYKFYIKHEHKIALRVLERKDYDKLNSSNYYIGNIMKNSKPSYMLDDLFDLKYLNKNTYGNFFIECTDIIKERVEYEKNKRIKNNE